MQSSATASFALKTSNFSGSLDDLTTLKTTNLSKGRKHLASLSETQKNLCILMLEVSKILNDLKEIRISWFYKCIWAICLSALDVQDVQMLDYPLLK